MTTEATKPQAKKALYMYAQIITENNVHSKRLLGEVIKERFLYVLNKEQKTLNDPRTMKYRRRQALKMLTELFPFIGESLPSFSPQVNSPANEKKKNILFFFYVDYPIPSTCPGEAVAAASHLRGMGRVFASFAVCSSRYRFLAKQYDMF